MAENDRTTRPIIFSGPMVRAILAGTKTQTRRVLKDPQATVRSEVRADLADLMPQLHETVARPGKARPATMNRHGAVCVRADDGRELGVKPGEFDFVCPYAEGRTYLDGGWRIEVAAGSRLWVRETWLPLDADHYTDPTQPREAVTPSDRDRGSRRNGAAYLADCDAEGDRIRAEYGYRWKPSIHMPRWASRLTLEVTEVRVQRLQDISEEDAKAEGVIARGPAGRTLRPHQRDFRALWDSINAKRAPWDSNPWVFAVTFRRVA